MIIKLLSSIIFLSCISLFISLGFWQLERANEKELIVNLYHERQLEEPENIFLLLKAILKKNIIKNIKLKVDI